MLDGVRVGVGVHTPAGQGVCVGVGVLVGVLVSVFVGVGVLLGVRVGVHTSAGQGVFVGAGEPATPSSAILCQEPALRAVTPLSPAGMPHCPRSTPLAQPQATTVPSLFSARL